MQSRHLSFSSFAAVWFLLAKRPRAMWLAAVFSILVLMTFTLVGASYLNQKIAASYADEMVKGGNVIVLASDQGQIERGQCSRLARRDDVISSGFVAFGKVEHPLHAPGVGLLFAEVDAGAIQVLGATDSFLGDSLWVARSSVVLSHGAAEAIGADRGSAVHWMTLGETKVAERIDVSERSPQMERWVFSLSGPSGHADECWIEAREGHRSSLEQSVRASIPSASGGALRVLRTDPPELAIDETVILLWTLLPWLCACAVSVVLAVAWLAERADLALLQVLGIGRVESAVVRSIQASAFLGICLGIGLAASSAIARVSGHALDSQVVSVLVPSLAAGILTSSLLSFFRPKSPVLLLRDRT